MAEAPGLGAGVDDVRTVREPVDDAFREPRVGEHLGPFAERQVGGDDQAGAFVSVGEDLEDELGAAVGQREVAELVDASVSDAGQAARARGWGSCRVIFSITLSSLVRVKVHSNGRAMLR